MMGDFVTMRRLRIMLMLIALLPAACDTATKPETDTEAVDLTDFSTALMALIEADGDQLRSRERARVVESAQARLAAFAAKASETEAKTIRFAPPASALCADDAMSAVPALAGQLASAGQQIKERLASCGAGCPALACEAYGAGIIDLEKSAFITASLVDRLGGISTVEEAAEAADQARWRSDSLSVSKETSDVLLALVRSVGAADAMSVFGTLQGLSQRARILATQGADMRWADRLKGDGAGDLVADLEGLAGGLATLASFLSDTDEAERSMAPALAPQIGTLVGETGGLAASIAARVNGLSVPQPPAGSSDTCILPATRALAAAHDVLKGHADRLRQCAAVRSCTERPSFELDAIEVARAPVGQLMTDLTESSQSLATHVSQFATAACE